MSLGWHDVLALADEVSAPQLWHWVAFNRLDPFTADRGDLQAAIVAATVANASGSKRRYRPDDFMPDFTPPETNPERMADMLSSMFPGVKK